MPLKYINPKIPLGRVFVQVFSWKSLQSSTTIAGPDHPLVKSASLYWLVYKAGNAPVMLHEIQNYILSYFLQYKYFFFFKLSF